MHVPPFSPPSYSDCAASFESVVEELSAWLVNAPAASIPSSIESGLERIVRALDLQYGALNLLSHDRLKFKVDFHYLDPEARVEIVPRGEVSRLFPWFTKQCAEGVPTIIGAIPDDFPPAAVEEREYCLRNGITASIILPICIGGKILGAMNFWTNRGPRHWPEGTVRGLNFMGRVFANAVYRQRSDEEAENHLQFEMLLSRLSALFINLPSEDVPETLQEALQLIVRFLGMDRGSIFERAGESDDVVCTASWMAEGVDPTIMSASYRQFPWLTGLLEKGETIVVPSTSALPAEAVREREHTDRYGIRTFVAIPLRVGGTLRGAISINSSREEREWTPSLTQRFRVFGDIIANAIARQRADERIAAILEENRRLQEQLEAENHYLRLDAGVDGRYSTIIGESDALKYVLFRVEQVARSDATVLILGETGTGKGLFSQAIHSNSPRKGQPFITVNCAALPPNLIESELFGREKGAFTGSHARQLGRFEVAHRGTIFLDEIGDLPLDLQAKLLRVIQDGQFERLGSPHTVTVDVRIIAATSRDMKEEIRQKRFREDLYYRLNVFPITIPPLRKRREDIPLLVEEFARRSARKMGTAFSSISRRDMALLQEYSWPGNVRELEGIVERMVITSTGSVLRLGEKLDVLGDEEPISALTDLTAVEREHIRKVLDRTGWKIEGRGGAAEVLKINPSTLRARMRKLELHRMR